MVGLIIDVAAWVTGPKAPSIWLRLARLSAPQRMDCHDFTYVPLERPQEVPTASPLRFWLGMRARSSCGDKHKKKLQDGRTPDHGFVEVRRPLGPTPSSIVWSPPRS